MTTEKSAAAIQTQQPQQVQKPARTPTQTLKDLLEERRASIAQLVPRHLNADRLMKVALHCVGNTPDLQKCSVTSLLKCIITSAELGLEPGGALGHAYLVPFGSDCTLIIGYRGFIKLMRNSGQLASIRAVVVHEKDKFKVREGIEQTIVHEPYLEGDAGPLRYVYCVAKLKDGSIQVEIMTRAQVDGIRMRSKTGAKGSGPWGTDYDEMAKKTVVRRIAKYLPLSAEAEKALEHDNADFVDAEVVASNERVMEDAGVQATEKAQEKVRRKLGLVDVVEIPADATPPAEGNGAVSLPAEPV